MGHCSESWERKLKGSRSTSTNISGSSGPEEESKDKKHPWRSTEVRRGRAVKWRQELSIGRDKAADRRGGGDASVNPTSDNSCASIATFFAELRALRTDMSSLTPPELSPDQAHQFGPYLQASNSSGSAALSMDSEPIPSKAEFARVVHTTLDKII